MRRRIPQGVRMYTGDDFNYAELIAGDEQGYSDALLGIFDAIAPAAAAALGALARGDEPDVPRHSARRPSRSRATSSGRRPASTRPASCSWPISTACRIISPWSAARRARARPCISRSSSASPTRPGCFAIRTSAAARMRAVLATRGVALMRDFSTTTRGLRSTRATVKSWPLQQLVEGCARAGITGDLALARPRRGGRASTARRSSIRDAGLTVTGYCRGGMFPAPMPPDGAPRSRTTSARSTRRPASARAASCWSRAGCRKARKDIAGARRRCATASLRSLPYARAARHAARDRAAASDVCRRPRLREHARAGARSLRRAGRRASASRSTSITCGGIRTLQRADRARRQAHPRLSRLRLAGADRPTCCSTAA